VRLKKVGKHRGKYGERSMVKGDNRQGYKGRGKCAKNRNLDTTKNRVKVSLASGKV
jgi:hypothetical protein